VLRHHLRRVLDRVAGLFVGTCLLQDVRGKHVTNIVGAVREEALDRSLPGPRVVVDAIALDRRAPGLIEGVLAIGSVGAGHLRRLDEERPRIGSGADEPRPVPVDPGFDHLVEPAEIRQDQPERLRPEERGIGILERHRRDQNLPALIAYAPAQLATLHVLKPALGSRERTSLAKQEFAQVLLAQTGVQADTQQ